MAKSSKNEQAKAQDELEPSFEQALGELESIVEAMEEQDMPLESLLENYEKGTALVDVCQKRLTAAELKVRKLEEDRGGSLTTEDFPSGEE